MNRSEQGFPGHGTVVNTLSEDPPHIEAHPGVELTVEIDGVYGQLRSTLVGQREGRYLILRTPLAPPGIATKLFKGNKLIVRYMEEGSAYAFQSTIMASIADPDPLLFLTWPTLLEEKSVRSTKRVDTHIACLVAVRDKAVEGTIIDLSLEGCRCILPTHLPAGILHLHMGDVILIEAQLGGDSVRLQGKLRNVAMLHTSARVGIRFDALRPEVEQPLLAFLIANGAVA